MDTLLKHLIYQNNKLNLKNYDHRKKKELQEKHYSESSQKAMSLAIMLKKTLKTK